MNLRKLIKGQRGVSLLELSVSMGVTTLVFAPLMATTFILVAAPQVSATQASATTQISNTSQWLSNDINSGQAIITGDQGSLASIGGTDYGSADSSYDQSSMSVEDGNLERASNADGGTSSTVTASRFVSDPESISFAVRDDISPDLIETIMSWTAEVPGGSIEHQESILNYMRSPVRKKPVGGYVMFATKDISVTGSKGVALGNIHANEILSLSGSDRSVAGYVESQGTVDLNGDDGVYEYINSRVPPIAMPASYDIVDFAPYQFTFVGNVNLNDHPEVWLDFSERKLFPGVYQATGEIQVSGSGLSGIVTFIGDEIKVSGSNTRLSAFKDGMLFFAVGIGNDVIDVSGSDGELSGIIYAPSGEVKITGSKRRFDGSILAEDIDVSGSDGWYAYDQDLFPQASAVEGAVAALPPGGGDGPDGSSWLAFNADGLLRPPEMATGQRSG